MKHELKITKDNYREVVLKRSIIICWVLLAICLVIKIFGGNFFTIVCENEKFVAFCIYFDSTFIKYVIYIGYFLLESNIFALILKPDTKLKNKRFVVYLMSCVLFWIIKVLVENNIIKISVSLFSFISMIILYLLLFMFSKKPVKSLLIILYQFAIAFVSSFIKNISFGGFMSSSALLTFIFYIDYYIVFILTYLYEKYKKGE